MTNSELNAALSLSRKISRLQGRLDDLRQTGGVGGKGDNTPVMGGSGGVCVGQIAAELEQEIIELLKEFRIEQVVLQRALDNIDFESTERKLMRLRYVACWDWKSVEKAIGYSHSRTMHYHSSAIEKTGQSRTPQDLKVACQ